MSTSFSHTATLAGAPDALWAAYSDKDYWLARIAAVGTADDRIDEFHHGDDGVQVVATHAIPDEEIPSAARKVWRGGLTIERTTRYEPFDGTKIRGTAHAKAAGGMGVIDGAGVAVAEGASTSTETVSGTVSVTIPLLGSKLEKLVVNYLDELFTAEYDHLNQWLAAN